MGQLEFVAFAVLLLVLVWVVNHQWKKRRLSTLRQVATDLGLEFYAKGNLSIIPNYVWFRLLGGGSNRKITNRMSGPKAYGEPVLFDYVDPGEPETYSQTVAWLNYEKDLPTFELRARNSWPELSVAFGHTEIDFQDRPGFSKRYRLTGRDESGKVSLLFSSLVTEFFEKREGLCIQAYKSGMLVYVSNRLLSAHEVPGFFRQAKMIYSLFNAASRLSESATT